jgi:hypothetical protein
MAALSDISVVSLTDVESVLLAGRSWSKVLVSDHMPTQRREPTK